jgi:16S rRNA C967 or C1407 C5-methylase (RsmB/RsmF family)/NOL1/NOP2/fmu family ribosome biogenesis protein
LSLPAPFLQTLEGVVGFNKAAFEAVHTSGETVTAIRVNPNKKPDQILYEHTSPVPWCPHGQYLNARPSFTLDPNFHAGAYYVQDASSMFLWQALTQVVGDSDGLKVLDLCAAPGGKSTLLSSYFKNGLVVSNEVIKQRAAVLVENTSKWGAHNMVVTNNDPSHFQSLPQFFNVMVVDAPCSGSGLFRKDPTAMDGWSTDLVALCAQRQQRILADALPALALGGTLIYATCSYDPNEDEHIADWLVNEMGLTSQAIDINNYPGIVETAATISKAPGYRFYPDQIKGEGFFIAAFKKEKDLGTVLSSFKSKDAVLEKLTKKMQEQLAEVLPANDTIATFLQSGMIKAIPALFESSILQLASQLYIKKAGVSVGELKGKDFIPAHEYALSYLPLDIFNMVDLDKEQALSYLRRAEFNCSGEKGWNLMRYNGLGLGWAKILPNRTNNYYPQEWRILKV